LPLSTGVKGKLSISKGGTGSTTSEGARKALGVDPKGTDNSDAVTLSPSSIGASIVGQELTIEKPDLSNTKGTLPVGSGGTGSQSPKDARKSLGLVIGEDVQAYSAPKPFVVQELTNSNLTPWNLSKSRVAKWSHSTGAKLAKASGGVDGETYELTITLSGTMVKFDASYVFSGDPPYQTTGVLEMSFKSNPMRAQWVHYTS
jgi:hypothetical protein